MKSNVKLVLTSFIASLTLVASIASATNGYFTHGTGTKNKGMAGAGIAMPEDAIAITNNPAAALLTAGKFDVGVAMFSPLRSYSSTESQANGNGGAFTIGPNDLDSDRNYFFIPHIARSWGLGDSSAVAVAFYGRGGMNTKWQGGTASFDPDGPQGEAPVGTFPGTFGAGTAGVDLSQAFIDLAYARKAGDSLTWGAGLIVGIQAFEANGINSFAGYTETFAASGGTEFPTGLTGNGHEFSFGVGLKAGVQVEVSSTTSIAAMYQSRIKMSEFDDYSDLFAEHGGFDIPANAKIGITFRPSDTLALAFDVEQVWYGDVDSIANPIANIFSCPTANPLGTDTGSCLGGDRGAGFGWEDMTIYKVGVEWTGSPEWTWRAGFSSGDQPIQSSEVLFNILAPGVIENHISAGFTKKMGETRELSFAVMHGFNKDVSGPNPFDPSQTIKIEMYQWEAELSYSWRF